MRATRWGLMALAASSVACRSPADCNAAPATVLGRWTYSATQMTPSMASLTGTLTLQSGCPSFQGTLNGTQADGLGTVTQVDGLVTGQLIDSGSVVFDAFFGASARRHLGAIAHDSIRGTWVDQTSGSNGSFVAAREMP